MSRYFENTGFVCEFCGLKVYPLVNGSYRNHCPRCLYSKHVDNTPGDRASKCQGLMGPIGLTRKSGKDFQIIHRCDRCSIERVNVIARDPRQPDDVSVWIALSTAAGINTVQGSSNNSSFVNISASVKPCREPYWMLCARAAEISMPSGL